MSWALGFDARWLRDIGYGVPAVCDQPGCSKQIDRGLSYVCGGEPYGGDHGCGLYFCNEHGGGARTCCAAHLPFTAKSDVPEWIDHKLTDESWSAWRSRNPNEVAQLTRLAAAERGIAP